MKFSFVNSTPVSNVGGFGIKNVGDWDYKVERVANKKGWELLFPNDELCFKRWAGILYKDKVVPSFLRQKRRYLLGSTAVCVVDERCTDGVRSLYYLGANEVPEIYAFLKKNKQKLVSSRRLRASSLAQTRNFGTLIKVVDGSVLDFQCYDPTQFAPARREGKSKVNHYGVYDGQNWQIYPVFDWANARRDGIYFLHSKDCFIGDGLWGVPDFIGTRKMLETRRLIEDYHLCSLTNGYEIRYRVDIPSEILAAIVESKKGKGKPFGMEDAKKLIQQSIDDHLKGVDASGGILYTYSLNIHGKEYKIEIETLDNSIGHEGYLKLNSSIEGLSSLPFDSNGILMGQQAGSKTLSSGSEIRNYGNLQLHIEQNDDRNLLLEVELAIMAIEGWQEMYPDYNLSFVIPDISLHTADKHAGGINTAGVV